MKVITFKLQKRVIWKISGVSKHTSYRQILRITTYSHCNLPLQVCKNTYLKWYVTSKNTSIHCSKIYMFITKIREKELDLRVQFCNIDLFGKSVVNMWTWLYNKVPDHMKKLEEIKSFKRELRSFLLQHAFYSVNEFMSYSLLVDCMSMWNW
jgi:hypothetical protein